MRHFILLSALVAGATLSAAMPVPQVPSSVQPALKPLTGVTSGVAPDPSTLHIVSRQIRNADFEGAAVSSSEPDLVGRFVRDADYAAGGSPSDPSASLEKRVELSKVPIQSLPVTSDVMKTLPIGRRSPADLDFKFDGADKLFQTRELMTKPQALSSDKRQLPVLGMITGAITKNQKPKDFHKPFGGGSPVPGLAGRDASSGLTSRASNLGGQALPPVPFVGGGDTPGLDSVLPVEQISTALTKAGSKAKQVGDASKGVGPSSPPGAAPGGA